MADRMTARLLIVALPVTLVVGLLGGYRPPVVAPPVPTGGGVMVVANYGERLLQRYRELQEEEDTKRVPPDTVLVRVIR